MTAPNANGRGILAIVVAMACFAGNDVIVKVVARELPLGEILFVRGLMTCLLVGSILVMLGHFGSLRFAAHPLVLLRSGFEATAALLFTSALVRMPIAELSTIVLVSPLIITALSVILYGELVGWRRWCAIAVGFAGTLLVVKPAPGSFDAWALVGLACAFASAGRDLSTRRLPPGIPSIVVSFMAAVAVTVVGAVMGVFETWRPVAAGELGLLAVGAVCLAGGNFLVVLAYRDGDVSAVAPFRYSLLLWAGLGGYFIFGEIPDRWSIAGALLIVASGIYALHREAVRARAARRRIAAAGASSD